MWDKENGGLPEIGLCDRIYVSGSATVGVAA